MSSLPPLLPYPKPTQQSGSFRGGSLCKLVVQSDILPGVTPHCLGADILANVSGVDPCEGEGAVWIDCVVADVCIHLHAHRENLS